MVARVVCTHARWVAQLGPARLSTFQPWILYLLPSSNRQKRNSGNEEVRQTYLTTWIFIVLQLCCVCLQAPPGYVWQVNDVVSNPALVSILSTQAGRCGSLKWVPRRRILFKVTNARCVCLLRIKSPSAIVSLCWLGRQCGRFTTRLTNWLFNWCVCLSITRDNN